MKSLGDHGPMRPSGQTQTSGGNGDDQSAVVGNERLTALAGAVLLVLIVVELIATTLVVIGSGIGLVVTGPRSAGPLLPLHGLSVLVWLPLIAIHVFAYIWRVPRLVANDWSKQAAEQAPGRGLRLGENLGALMLGAIAAVLLLPGATPWIAWSQTNGTIPAPMIVGMLVATLALLATRPLRWR